MMNIDNIYGIFNQIRQLYILLVLDSYFFQRYADFLPAQNRRLMQEFTLNLQAERI